MTTVYILLAIIFAIVLFFPFIFKKVEHRLEFFMLLAGIASVTASHSWSHALLEHSLKNPLGITLAVLLAGLAFQRGRTRLNQLVHDLIRRLGGRGLSFLLVFLLGLVSGLITALVAALALSETLILMRLSRGSRVRIAVLGCFSIGLGAVLTPLGEPLATISIARLSGEPHHAGFWFMVGLLGVRLFPLLLGLGWAAARSWEPDPEAATMEPESVARPWDMTISAGKVYVFVVGLELLGAGFNPATGDLLKRMPAEGLYFASLVSAVLDNASLAAAGLSPAMSVDQLRYFMFGLMLSGGMLIPGNFPNIICAEKLKISHKEWAREAIPAGIVLLCLVFAALNILDHFIF